MIHLPLLQFKDRLRLRKKDALATAEVFDPLRKKWLVAQPEELVRQLLVQYLLTEKAYPRSRIRLEMGLRVNRNYRRCDLLVFDRTLQPYLLAECKAPGVSLDEKVREQIEGYHFELQASFLLITNGEQAFAYRRNAENRCWDPLEDLPPPP